MANTAWIIARRLEAQKATALMQEIREAAEKEHSFNSGAKATPQDEARNTDWEALQIDLQSLDGACGQALRQITVLLGTT